MVEGLEHLIRRAAREPLAPRSALLRELLRSDTYLLTLDEPLADDESRRVTRADASFPVWADRDPELGGVWVPVFPARDRVRDFVAARRLRAPRGKEFLWMGHQPGQVFALLRGVPRFAGLRLHLDRSEWASLSWPEVRFLAEGRLPPEEPAVYELPCDRLVIPAGARLSLGRLKPWEGEPRPLLMTMPDAGRFRPEDARRLVRLPMSDGRRAWTPCRHYLQILRYLKRVGAEGSGPFARSLLAAELSFEMYGEAEAFCEWLAHRGREAYAWLGLAAVYGRVGRLEDCVRLCARAAAKYPGERSFHVQGARALMALRRYREASAGVAAALRLFPGDRTLSVLARDLSAQLARAA